MLRNYACFTEAILTVPVKYHIWYQTSFLTTYFPHRCMDLKLLDKTTKFTHLFNISAPIDNHQVNKNTISANVTAILNEWSNNHKSGRPGGSTGTLYTRQLAEKTVATLT